jgi:hypothetical protein
MSSSPNSQPASRPDIYERDKAIYDMGEALLLVPKVSGAFWAPAE